MCVCVCVCVCVILSFSLSSYIENCYSAKAERHAEIFIKF